MFSQEKHNYYVKLKPNINLGIITKTENPDKTLTLQSSVPDFSNFLSTKNVYEFKEAFPNLQSPILQNVYYLTMDENASFMDISARSEVESVDFLEQEILTADPPLPNDYNEINLDNRKNTALELINAPLAWTVTKGDPSILVAVIDSHFDVTHPDLINKIEINIDDSHSSISHGTGVANFVAGDTNNGVGVASIGYNTKLITADSYSTQRAIEISQMPGVKVVNCSFAGSYYNAMHDAAITEISQTLGVLFVAGAGNNKYEPYNVYKYPASYDSVLSVTSVGNRYDYGSQEASDDNFWARSWKDVHEFRPHTAETKSHTHNDKVDVSAPGHWVQWANDNYFNPNTNQGYYLGIGTSASSPIAAGLAALIYSINPNFTAQEVKDIIKNTADDIYHIPENQPYIGQLGTGRINAFRAVKTADCIVSGTAGLDLAMQNSAVDTFVEPDTETEYVWHSEDIWVRNQDDGFLVQTSENPEYSKNNPPYIYVRVTNNSCEVSTAADSIELYWSKANTSMEWPLHWTGGLTITDPTTNQDVLMGDQVGTIPIPALGPGESKIIEFLWNNMPDPADYQNINDDPWHFCLLARIESRADPMTFPEGTAITENVTNNNNLVWKNLTVVDIDPNNASNNSGTIAVANFENTTKAYYLQFISESNEQGKPLYEEAEITLKLDDILYSAYINGGEINSNFKDTANPKIKIVTENDARLNNILISANTLGTLNLSFHFLAEEQTPKRRFTYHVIQRDAATDEIIGGETYEINKKPKPNFEAYAGEDEEIEKNEQITITAAQINEAATYNWYDPDGNLIHTGESLTVAPNVTKKYKLEVIVDNDGYKDYDEVEVVVNPYKLESLVPNPAVNDVTVNYIADEATSAYLMVVDNTSGILNNYVLNTQEYSYFLDISNYSPGNYTIALVCEGEIQNAKILFKN